MQYCVYMYISFQETHIFIQSLLKNPHKTDYCHLRLSRSIHSLREIKLLTFISDAHARKSTSPGLIMHRVFVKKLNNHWSFSHYCVYGRIAISAHPIMGNSGNEQCRPLHLHRFLIFQQTLFLVSHARHLHWTLFSSAGKYRQLEI